MHNHARMYLASYVVHFRRVRWQAGAEWFLTHLLDGNEASNNFSWQWVASTLSQKPYIFNLENVQNTLLTWSILSQNVMKFWLMATSSSHNVYSHIWRHHEPTFDMLHEQALYLAPYLTAIPNAQFMHIWDDDYYQQRQYTLKRLVFIYESLCESNIPIIAGNTLDVIHSRKPTKVYIPNKSRLNDPTLQPIHR